MDGDNGRLLRNAWYVCAWDHEIGAEPLQRWICGEPIVFWRRTDGRPAALADRCPHRDAPLSLGKVIGDDIQCGYHGLCFDAEGRCVAVPGEDRIPAEARTRSYPVVERWGWVFVWTGDPARADPASIPDYHWKDDPAWSGKGETLHVKAHYGLLRDNLLDLTHAHYVHRQTLATDGVIEFPIETDFDGERLSVVRDMRDIAPSPFFSRIGRFTGNVDHRQEIVYTPPGNIVIKLRVAGAAGEANRTVGMRVLNALTPETAKTTHYFWSLLRDVELDDEELTRWAFQANKDTFDEDVAVIEPQQRMIDTAPEPARPIRWSVDKGVTQAHRWIERLLDEEAGPTAGDS